MNSIENYFEKKRKEQHKLDIQMAALAKEISLLAFDLNALIPYGVCFTYSGSAENVNIYIYDEADHKQVWDTDFYVKGQLADLKKGKEVKKALQEAIKFKRLPKEIAYLESYRKPLTPPKLCKY